MKEDTNFELLKKEIKDSDLKNLVQARTIYDDNKIIELMSILKDSDNFSFNAFIFLICCLSEETCINWLSKLQHLDNLESVFPKLCDIKDDALKRDYLDNMDDCLLFILIALSLEDYTLRDRYMSIVKTRTLEKYTPTFKNEELILRIMPYIYEISEDMYYGLKQSCDNLRYINSENRARGIYSLAQYSQEANEVMHSIFEIKNRSTKLKLIKQNNFINDLGLNIIKNTSNDEERRFLINGLYDIKNRNVYFQGYDKQFLVPKYKSSLPKDLLFGVEIECFGDSARPILYYFPKILGYDVKIETALPDGLEFSSPKLSWNNKDLNSIYQVCDFAKVNYLRCVGRSGGHIHFSSDYLNTRDAWYWFFYLYSKFEKILYKICNPIGQKPRKNVFSIAKPFSRTFVLELQNLENIYDKDEFIKEVQDLFDTKFIGMNLGNIFYRFNTIEFRIPNGTLDPDEIIKRILLFGNLLKLAKKLSVLPLNKKFYVKVHELDNETNEEIILEIMLDMMFESEDEKDIFKSRYQANKEFNQDIEYDMKSFSFKKRGINI